MNEFGVMLANLAVRIDVRWVLPLALVVLAHFLAEPGRWRIYLHRDPKVTLRGLLHIFSLTALVGYMLPAKLGLPVRILLLRRYFDLSLSGISALLVIDGSIYYAGWGLAALVGLPWVVGFGWSEGRALLLAGSSLFVAGIAVIGLLRYSARLPAGLASKIGTVRQRCSEALQFATGALTGWSLLASAAITGLDIAGHTLRHGILLAMLGQSLPLPNLFATTTLSIFAGLISLMPMGLGGYDLMLVLLLKMNGIPASEGLAVAVANRMANLVMSIMLGGWGGAALGIGTLNRRALARLASSPASDGSANSPLP